MNKIQNLNNFDQQIIEKEMPKAVDIYVLDKKIGSGQFGDVYKGYSKIDGTQVAIKTIRRDKVKGKFTQLLDNQIQVLKSCKNNNIIRLIDIKKTVNNIYLILQYCNQGDLSCYLKQKKHLPQQQSIEYFVQILHAFQTLVKNKIMHRDFKLPNVLKHDGVIKIADFGFAKLLGQEDQQAQTILGSPLNMAPEVLDHRPYNNKADIWSIGVAFYQMVFGKVPYMAGNIIDLLKKIKKDPLTFPRASHPLIEDVLKKMLVVNPQKRIEWNDLFKHPINRILQQRIQQSLQQSMLCKKQQLPYNISKFYIKTNRVIQTPNELFSKQQLNKYVKTLLSTKQIKKYQGPLIKRKTSRQNKQNQSQMDKKQMKEMKTEKNIQNQQDVQDTQIVRDNRQQLNKNNMQKVLYQRNRYAFYGHLAEELLQFAYNHFAIGLAFLLVKRVVQTIGSLKTTIKQRKFDKIQNWQEFQQSPQHKRLIQFLNQEEEIFNNFYEKLALKVLQQGTLEQFQQQMMISGKFTRQETNKKIYQNVLREYLKLLENQLKKSSSTDKKLYCHVIKLLDGNKDNWPAETLFEFNKYYNSFNQISINDAKACYQQSLQIYRKTLG